VGNARSAGSFSATVKLLTTVKNVGGACAYASNYPPVGKYTSATNISFTGTPKYDLVLEKIADGSTYTISTTGPYSIHAGEAIQSFTDATGAPGIFVCVPSMAYTLVASASSFCAGDAGVTFSLPGTQLGQRYELRKGAAVVATLTGDGSAATFSSSFGAGIYSAWTIPGGTFCPAEVTGTHEVSEIPLPTMPTAASTYSRCGSGTVTFNATAPGSCTIDWYTSSTGTTRVSGGSSITSISPSLTATTTYHAQARNTTTGCVSTTRLAVTGTVISVPVITTHPATTATCSGSTVSLSVVASNATAYQWKKGSSNVVDGSGGTTANYTTAALTAGATYSVVVANGACSVTSNNALVSIQTDGCDNFTLCPGFTIVSTVSHEDNSRMYWMTADGYCRGKGTNWRLPTLTELKCLCANGAALPGGYVDSWYWSSSRRDDGYYETVTFGICRDGISLNGGSGHVKCVR
jgi:hypothetical protein